MVLCARLSWSDGGRVVVVDPDPRVFAAVNVALSPWSLRVIRVGGPLPQADVVAATSAAKALAENEHAGAVLWVAPPSGSQVLSLWLYDAQTAQLVVRPLTVAAPFDDAAAAAIALSVKTIMRGSPLLETSATLPPATEASPAGTAPPGPAAVPTPAPSPTTPPTTAAPPPAPETKPSASATPTPPPVAPSTPAPPAPKSPSASAPPTPVVHEPPALSKNEPGIRWRLEIVGGARGPTGASAGAEPETGIGVSAWPSALGGHFGIGAVGQFGLATSITKGTFDGQFTQGSLALTARARASLGPVGFEAQAGPSLRITSFDGTEQSEHSFNVDPGIDAAAAIDLALGSHLTLGGIVDLSTLLREQSYDINNGPPLFAQRQFDVFYGARLSLEVD
ncbi:MAG TPA: hypothetical protein VK841_19020 [Polyangiaceae bacterium]|jgi:hypothetical protein|nr:hypothetical protein [Polyangiaceae bacterium]